MSNSTLVGVKKYISKGKICFGIEYFEVAVKFIKIYANYRVAFECTNEPF